MGRRRPDAFLLRCEPRPDETPKGGPAEMPWVVETEAAPLLWAGFYTGPLVFSAKEVEKYAAALLGAPPERVRELAAASLRPHVLTTDVRPPAVILHSATQTTKGFEGDLSEVAAGRRAHDVATYIETRAVYLARKGDIAVGRTHPWRVAAARAGVDSIDVGRTELYYLSHALLEAAVEHEAYGVRQMNDLIEWLRRRPHGVVRLYALDREMQIFLLWLMRRAGLDSLYVDANSAAVADEWNQKGPLHPTVAKASRPDCSPAGVPPQELLASEQRLSALHEKLGITIPVLPGYTIERAAAGRREFAEQLIAAAAFLRERYGISRGCLKPSEAGDGARIVFGVDLDDRAALERLAEDAHRHGDDYLLEPQVEYLKFELNAKEYIVAPSAHIRFGRVAPGCTVQLLENASWVGNVYVDEATCHEFNISTDQYRQVMAATESLLSGFRKPGGDGADLGLVMGGIDFAVGRVGGRFGDTPLVAAQDPNLSSHGAEYLRGFIDHVEEKSPRARPTSAVYAATKVLPPAAAATWEEFDRMVREGGRPGVECDVIACIPGRWSMVAATGRTSKDAAHNVLELERRLARGALLM